MSNDLILLYFQKLLFNFDNVLDFTVTLFLFSSEWGDLCLVFDLYGTL